MQSSHVPFVLLGKTHQQAPLGLSTVDASSALTSFLLGHPMTSFLLALRDCPKLPSCHLKPNLMCALILWADAPYSASQTKVATGNESLPTPAPPAMVFLCLLPTAPPVDGKKHLLCWFSLL